MTNQRIIDYLQRLKDICTATNMEDPRIVLRSNDLTTWSSPYAYWHA